MEDKQPALDWCDNGSRIKLYKDDKELYGVVHAVDYWFNDVGEEFPIFEIETDDGQTFDSIWHFDSWEIIKGQKDD